MAKKITIQHYYTTGSTAPAHSALTLGEIAMSTKSGEEGIYFKNNESEIVKVLTSGQTSNLISNSHNLLAQQISTHTTNGGIHITSTERTKWNDAASAITTFLVSTEIEGAIDTLKEIQGFLSGDTTGVADMLGKINQNTEDITTNTNSITGLSADVNMLKDEGANHIKMLNGDAHIIANKAQNQIWQLTHASASTQNSAITATNNTTGLSFGSDFKIVNKVAYDKNGHVVSGSTQTLKLPTIPTATTGDYGMVKIQSGELSITNELLSSPTGIAADINHYHSQYVKFTDLTGNTGNNITISCGTY